MSPLIEQHHPGPIELAWEPRDEEAGPSSKGMGSDPALSRQSDWSNASDRPDRHGLGPGESSALRTSPQMGSWWLSELRNAIRHLWKCQVMSDRKRKSPGLEPGPWMLLWGCSPSTQVWLVAAVHSGLVLRYCCKEL